MTTRKEKEKRELQQKIFDAATAITVAEGYEKLSIRKIAKAIDYSPTTIYNYFKNKDEILLSIAYDVYQEVVSNVTTALTNNQQLSATKRFQLSCEVYMSTMLANPEKFRAVMLTSNLSLSEESEEDASEGNRILQDILTEGSQKGEFTAVNDESAQLILISLMGIVFYIVSYRLTDAEQVSSLAQAHIELLLRGIGGSPADK